MAKAEKEMSRTVFRGKESTINPLKGRNRRARMV
jgi:hypothetical protein